MLIDDFVSSAFSCSVDKIYDFSLEVFEAFPMKVLIWPSSSGSLRFPTQVRLCRATPSEILHGLMIEQELLML